MCHLFEVNYVNSRYTINNRISIAKQFLIPLSVRKLYFTNLYFLTLSTTFLKTYKTKWNKIPKQNLKHNLYLPESSYVWTYKWRHRGIYSATPCGQRNQDASRLWRHKTCVPPLLWPLVRNNKYAMFNKWCIYFK